MSKIKNWLEEERIQEIERRCESGEFDFLYLFTTDNARPVDGDSDFFFQVYGDVSQAYCDVAVISVKTKICNCKECRFFEDLREYVSIRAGLRWSFENFGTTSIWLWVTSNQFIEEAYTGFQNSEITCEFRSRLIDDLVQLFDKIEIQVEEYDYEDRMILPFDVKGRTSNGSVEDSE